MFQSIIVYGLIILALYICCQVGVKIKGNTITTIVSQDYYLRIFIGIMIFTFFSAVRWDVGIDHLSYYESYVNILNGGAPDRHDLEVGYKWYQIILAKLHAHFAVYFGILAFLQLFFAIQYFNKEKFLIPYLCLIIMCGGDYFFWMNGIRQALVGTCFLFVVSKKKKKRRIILYLFLVSLLSFFHKSAIFLLPLCLLFYMHLEKIYINKLVQLLLFVGALALSEFSIWQSLLGFTEKIVTFIGYDRFTDGVLDSLEVRNMNFGLRRLIFLLIDLIIIAYSDKLRITYTSKKFGFAFLMFCVFYVLYPLFISSLVFSRIVAYFTIFRAIMGAYLLFYLFRIRRTQTNVLVGIFVVCLFILHILIQIYADPGHHTDCIRYHFFWEQLI